jgi:hypothetical protein
LKIALKLFLRRQVGAFRKGGALRRLFADELGRDLRHGSLPAPIPNPGASLACAFWGDSPTRESGCSAENAAPISGTGGVKKLLQKAGFVIKDRLGDDGADPSIYSIAHIIQ